MGCIRPCLLAPLLTFALSGPMPAVANDGAGDPVVLCPGYALTAPVEPPLSAEEVRMVCGFPAAEGTGDEVWAEIPRNQALTALRAALQTRAHHRPRIQEGPDGVVVDPGERTRVESVSADGAPPGFDIRSRSDIVGEPLVPEVLDTLEGWAIRSLQRLGFACPRVSSSAGVAERHVLVDIAPGERRPFGPVRHVGVEGALEGQLERFHAFREDWMFDRTAIDATSARLIGEGVVEAAEFVPVCAEGGRGVIARIVPGESRLVAVRPSASTEEWLRVDGRFLHRAAGSGYLLLSEAAARVSRRIQEISLSTAWYPATARLWIEPVAVVRRMDERPFELTTAQIGVDYGRGGDRPGVGWEVRVGPHLAGWWIQDRPGESSREGPWRDDVTALSLRLAARLWSHEHEVWRTEPQGGWAFDAQATLAGRGIASDFDALHVDFGGTAQINVRGDFPPTLLLALRGRAGTTFTDEGAIGRLPPVYLHYLGGMDDLRGFRRMALPGAGGVALSRAFIGIEARPALLPVAWEPLAFVDVGMLGEREGELDGPAYWSAGAGVKWNSPVGPLRATLGNGWAGDDSEGLVLFLSWGEAF